MTNVKQALVERGEAIDISQYPRRSDGSFILSEFIDGKHYVVLADNSIAIHSIGRRKSDGVILASTDCRYGRHPDFECLWMRPY
jgi:hypothetical protein